MSVWGDFGRVKNVDRKDISSILSLDFGGVEEGIIMSTKFIPQPDKDRFCAAHISPQPRKIQFLRTFGVGPFFFFFGSNQRERYFSMEHGRWKVARRSLHQLPQPPPETFDDDNPQPPKINWSP